MSYKLGLMLSLVFLMCVFLMAGDMFCISAIHSDLDSMALVVSYCVSRDGRVTSDTLDFVEDHGALMILPWGTPRIGDIYTFTVYKEYTPIIISNKPIKVTVVRSSVVGYYQGFYGERG